MNRYLSWTCWALIGILFFGYNLSAAAAPAPGEQAAPGKEVKADSPTGYLEDILFEKSPGRERVVLVLSRQAGAQIDSKTETSLQVRLPNTFVPEELRKPLGQGSLSNVLRALPSQQTEAGKPLTLIAIDLQQRRTYLVKQEGNNVVIDFHVGAQTVAEGEKVAAASGAGAEKQAATPAAAEQKETVAVPSPASQDVKQEATKADVAVGPRYTGPEISIDFQDTELRVVLRVLGELAGKNIVTSPEVKGPITINMQKVPWGQVLKTIMDLYGLAKREEGNVITVVSLDKENKDETAKMAAVEARTKAELAVKEANKKTELEKGNLRQLMIEAKILEVNETFLRDLGVRWGAGVQTNLGNNDYSMGMLGGTSTLATPITKLTTGVSLTKDALAMNFGAGAFGLTSMTPTLGIIMGGSNAILNAQIAALEQNSKGRVLSSPRVLTQDAQKATIEQGEEIPLVTPATANNPATTTYRKVPLTLEVTPEIKSDNHILLTVLAKNERVNRSEKDAQGNYPFYTSKVDSKVVVKDGDTIVIGGILKTEDTVATYGVPWLSKIPLLGWLFKFEEVQKIKRELLIFVTPRIIKADEAAFTRM